MSTLAYESNTDLAYDTSVMRSCAKKYASQADELLDMASELNKCLATLASSGWTTQAGKNFQLMVDTDWVDNIQKYADLLDLLSDILIQSASEYEKLTSNYIEKTKIK